MRSGHICIGLAALLCLLSTASAVAAKPAEQPYSYGPPPEWGRYVSLAEGHIRARLIDPRSAQFTWIYGYTTMEWKPFLERRVHGYVACGLINSKNRMGGYVGDTFFVVAIDHDQLLFEEIAGRGNFADIQCQQAIRSNLFPPVSDMPRLVAGSASLSTAL